MSATEQRKALSRVVDAFRRVKASARSAASAEPLVPLEEGETPPEQPQSQQQPAPPR